ncbi:Actin cytoskeleton-regulatory complex pan-like protein [Quillaja saponaria]|uniref:Actin cytoskeleton-regulatory complex pan-like protein n=1 Tax=Quillaja saponaria TaxID=32244 RepID=A0AAD7KUU6_QUISA|nr:Actin cytoskeleton-regulatory complex pan-like protein [Quillaja saponaria]
MGVVKLWNAGRFLVQSLSSRCVYDWSLKFYVLIASQPLPPQGFCSELGSCMSFTKPSVEGKTKWDSVHCEESNEIIHVDTHKKLLDNYGKLLPDTAVSTLQAELVQAQICISKLKASRLSSQKKVKHFLQKLEEEKISWKSRERQKIRAAVHDLKDRLGRERKYRKKLEILNRKLINELADAKLSAKQSMQSYKEERKCRKLMEEVCNELARRVREDKVEVEELKRESVKFSEEMEEERKMLQMAVLLREEQVQMKLQDAKLALEDKYYQLNQLIKDLQSFLRPRSGELNMMDTRKVKLIQQAAQLVDFQDVEEFSCDPSKSGDVFSIFEEFRDGKANEREIERCFHPSPASHYSGINIINPDEDGLKDNPVLYQSNLYVDIIGLEDNGAWETVSNAVNQDSIFSLERNDPSVGMEHNENAGLEYPYTGVSEVCSVSSRQPTEKGSSISNLRSCPSNVKRPYVGVTSQYTRSGQSDLRCLDSVAAKSSAEVFSDKSNRRLPSNTTISSVRMTCPKKGSGDAGFRHCSAVAWRSSPDAMNPHITRGINGYVEWPRGIPKSKNSKSRAGSLKPQLHRILKQKT